jgi:hypothetical protein
METAKMPTIDEWIRKMWYLYIMEFYLATKKKEIMSMSGKWKKLDNKAACSLSYVDYRPKTTEAILWNRGGPII